MQQIVYGILFTHHFRDKIIAKPLYYDLKAQFPRV